MFTGIVETMGRVVRLAPRRHGRRFVIIAPRLSARVRQGDSVAVNGVCLSAVARRGRQLSFDVIPETLRRTTLRTLRAGDAVNVERAMRARDRLHGHVLLGHVDGTARVTAIAPRARDRWLDLRMPQRLAPYCVPKGSLAVDGVSLTIGRVSGRRVRLYLIPMTLRKTTLGRKRAGDRVNVEADILVKAALRRRGLKR